MPWNERQATNPHKRILAPCSRHLNQRIFYRRGDYFPQAGDHVVTFSDIHARGLDDRFLTRNPKLSLNAL